MVKIKICGLKNQEEINVVNKFDIDYAGFILAKSKREISNDILETLIKKLNHNIIPVGVFVNADFSKIKDAVVRGIKIIQLHGDEDCEYISKLKNMVGSETEIWKAVRVGEKKPEKKEFIECADRYLFDKYKKETYGGTGEKFDWNLVSGYSSRYSIVLAGGINEDNVADAVNTVKPFCIDISSGVETEGQKDEIKINKILNILKEI